jgi:hypothetical protein
MGWQIRDSKAVVGFSCDQRIGKWYSAAAGDPISKRIRGANTWRGQICVFMCPRRPQGPYWVFGHYLHLRSVLEFDLSHSCCVRGQRAKEPGRGTILEAQASASGSAFLTKPATTRWIGRSVKLGACHKDAKSSLFWLWGP